MTTGPYANNEGFRTEASGAASHAQGIRSKATNEASHAQGKNTLASGLYSHSQGCTTVASGQSSHAQGERTKAVGAFSHSQGYQTKATGNTSTAIGRKIEVSGEYSVGIQLDNISNRVLSSNRTFCVIGGNSGFGLLNPSSTLHVKGTSSLDLVTSGTWNGDLIGISYGGTGANNASAARSNLGLTIGSDVQPYSSILDSVSNETYIGCGAINTLGTVLYGNWNASKIEIQYGGTGGITAAEARDNLGLEIGVDVQPYNEILTDISEDNYEGSTQISNLGTIQVGTWTATPINVNYGGCRGSDAVKVGIHSVAMGRESKSQGSYSYAFGYGSLSTGYGSIALASYKNEINIDPESCIASGDHSVAMSPENIAAGRFSISGGLHSINLGDNSVSIGENCFVSGEGSYVFGKDNIVGNQYLSCSISDFVVTILGDVSDKFQVGDKVTIIYSDVNDTDCLVADSSFGDAAGTYCLAGTYNDSNYYTSTNGWTIYFDNGGFVWIITPAGLGNFSGEQDIYHWSADPGTAPLAGWANGGTFTAGASPKMRRSVIRTISSISSETSNTEITLNAGIYGVISDPKIVSQREGSKCFVFGENSTVLGDNCFVVNLDGSEIETNTNNSMIVVGGNVGIGTTDPSAKLEISEESGSVLIGEVSGDLCVRVEDESNSGISITPNGIVFPDETILTTATTITGDPVVVSLSYSSNISTNASLGQIFDITLSGDATIDNPINPVNGKTIRWRVTQDNTGNRNVVLGSKFNIPSSATGPLPWSTAANKMDVLAATYHAGRDKWDVVSFVPGY